MTAFVQPSVHVFKHSRVTNFRSATKHVQS